MKNCGRTRQSGDSIGRKFNKRKKKKMSGRGHKVKQSSESKSDVECVCKIVERAKVM